MLISSRAFAWSIPAALTGAAMTLCVPPAQAAADPSDPHAQVPPVVYQSPLAGVRQLNDAALGAWRQVSPPLSRAASAPAAPKPGPHAGHSPSSQ